MILFFTSDSIASSHNYLVSSYNPFEILGDVENEKSVSVFQPTGGTWDAGNDLSWT